MKRSLRAPSTLPKQKSIVVALLLALATTAGADAGRSDQTTAGLESSAARVARRTPALSQIRSIEDWRSIERPRSADAQVLIDAWRARHATTSAKSAPTPTGGATHVVENCLDDGSDGSLRATIDGAASGEVIEMTGLVCSTITLTDGQIEIDEHSLHLIGPGASLLSISGDDKSRVLRHDGGGTLRIDGLSIEKGFLHSEGVQAKGGCIFSFGNLQLNSSEVIDCMALSPGEDAIARGGGVYAQGSITANSLLIAGNAAANKYGGEAAGGGLFGYGSISLTNSLVVDNTAYSTEGDSSLGGGVFAYGNLSVKYTQIAENSAGWGGGLIGGFGDVTIANSTISGNDASYSAGGGLLYSIEGTTSVRNSTISNNASAGLCGGLTVAETNSQDVIANSTITSNTAGEDSSICGGGLQTTGQLRLESTIVADNFAGGVRSDIRGFGNASIVGADNLIYESNLPVPGDTVTGTSPLLGPLAFNGGITRTHALGLDSPALDAGNATLGGVRDQRGGQFLRTVNLTDIGAYEFQGDVIFADDFED